VDHLINETHGRAGDNDVQRVFMATYRLFTTDEDLSGFCRDALMRWGTISASHTPGFPFDSRESIAHSRGRSLTRRKKDTAVLASVALAEGEHMDHELLSPSGRSRAPSVAWTL